MPTLTELSSDPARRGRIVDDMALVVEEEVASKTGLTGLAIKAAFGVVKALKPGIIREMCSSLLPEFAAALDPIVDARPAGRPAAEHLLANGDRVTAALLGVTDARARKTDHATLLKAYQKLRPMAEKQVVAALPRVGRVLGKYFDEPRPAAQA